MLYLQKNAFNVLHDFHDLFLGILVSPKIKTIGFGARGHVQKSRNHRNDGFFVLPYANRKVISSNFTELLSIS